MSIIRNNLGKLVIAIALLVIVGFGARKFLGTSQTVAPYQTTPAQTGSLVTTISGSGTMTSGSSVNITTQASGLVQNVYVQNGDTVTKGQKIADLILDLDSQQKLAAANASYQSALNSLNSAQENKAGADATLWKDRQTVLDAQNTEDLKNQGVNNPSTKQAYTNLEEQVVDSALIQANKQFDVDQQKVYDADQAITSAKATLASDSLTIAQTSATVTAPMSGVITNLTLVPGLAIAASTTTSGTTTSQSFGRVSLAQSQPQAIINLSEIDAVQVQTGQKVTMTLDAFPGKTFTGRVLAINTNGTVSSGVTTYPATIGFDASENGLYPNMAVTAKVITNVEDNVLLVPSAAVQTVNGQATVRMLKNGQPQTVQVQIGDSNDSQTVITSGLSEGDQVITGGGPTASNRPTSQGGTSPFSAFGGRGLGGGGGGGGARVIRGD